MKIVSKKTSVVIQNTNRVASNRGGCSGITHCATASITVNIDVTIAATGVIVKNKRLTNFIKYESLLFKLQIADLELIV